MKEVTQPLVSVVICCYNQACFLSESISSVLCQSYRPIELIVIDDGSTDDTAAVVANFEAVKYLHQANAGLASARNAGLHASAGRFIAFLDADDRLLPLAIALGMQILVARPKCAFAAGQFCHIDAQGRLLSPSTAPSRMANEYVDLLRFNIIEMHGAVLYRREKLNSIGGFDERLAAAEDYDVFLRLARRHPFARYDQVIAQYRQHNDNMTRDTGRLLVATVSALQKQRPHVAGHADLEAALDVGLTHYRSAYGRALLRKAVKRLYSLGEWERGLREIAFVLRHAPVAVPSALRRLVSVANSRATRLRQE